MVGWVLQLNLVMVAPVFSADFVDHIAQWPCIISVPVNWNIVLPCLCQIMSVHILVEHCQCFVFAGGAKALETLSFQSCFCCTSYKLVQSSFGSLTRDRVWVLRWPICSVLSQTLFHVSIVCRFWCFLFVVVGHSKSGPVIRCVIHTLQNSYILEKFSAQC